MATNPKRTQGNSDAVLRYFMKNRNVEVHYSDIATETEREPAQVMSAISHLRKSTEIASPRKGWYIYKGPNTNGHSPVAVTAKAKVQAILDDGRLLLLVEGRLYVAHEIEV